ncbi:STT3 [Symbiodinium microadriaticum]|nr:STT3 [Symbiodinium microadriaticum]
MALAQRLLRGLLDLVVGVVKALILLGACLWAYRIRLLSVQKYGYLIHEFDPWFNARATKYLAKQGWHAFFHWYDYMSWYPLGRPIGTTIYPGMQILSVWIWRALKVFPSPRSPLKWEIPSSLVESLPAGWISYLPGHGKAEFSSMNVNDVCVMVPAWLAAVATFSIFLLTWEVSESSGAGVAAAVVMAIIPAHLMRSMTGYGRVRVPKSMIGLKPFFLMELETYLLVKPEHCGPGYHEYLLDQLRQKIEGTVQDKAGLIISVKEIEPTDKGKLHEGTGLIMVPMKYNALVLQLFKNEVVDAEVTELNKLGFFCEVGPARVFVSKSLLPEGWNYSEAETAGGASFVSGDGTSWIRREVGVRVKLVATKQVTDGEGCRFGIKRLNYFSPWSARIRGLFLKHRKTGNPLVDSVAEHQAASDQAYDMYLGTPRYFAFVGLFFCWHQRTPAKIFPVLFAAVAYHFSLKMSRLLIICGPIVSILAGYPVGLLGDWCLEQVKRLLCGPIPAEVEEEVPTRTGGMGSIYRICKMLMWPVTYTDEVSAVEKWSTYIATKHPLLDRSTRLLLAAILASWAWREAQEPWEKFVHLCYSHAESLAEPGLAYEARLRNGKTIIVDDYYQGYLWIDKNTPPDSRVLAWWDYGYQITGIAKRTSVADGNTWNHEHIATIGRILSNPVKKSHNIMRHLADYVLVWAGERETDLRISTHFARIGNSVFPDICGPRDPTCSKYAAYPQPTPMMRESFVYNAVKHKLLPDVELNPKLFKEVHTTKHGLMRIYQVLNVSQESKDWVADPANRICDAPGSWYCVGQYPPALKKLIAKRKNFSQLEDFNRKQTEKSDYTRLIEKQQAETGRDAEL